MQYAICDEDAPSKNITGSGLTAIDWFFETVDKWQSLQRETAARPVIRADRPFTDDRLETYVYLVVQKANAIMAAQQSNARLTNFAKFF